MRNMINKPTVLWRQWKNVGEPPLVFAPEFTLIFKSNRNRKINRC